MSCNDLQEKLLSHLESFEAVSNSGPDSSVIIKASVVIVRQELIRCHPMSSAAGSRQGCCLHIL